MNPRVSHSVVAGLSIAILFLFGPTSEAFGDNVATAIRNNLITLKGNDVVPGFDRIRPSLRKFYKARNFEPAWVTGNSATERIELARDIIHGARAHGLDPDSYVIEGAGIDVVPKTAARQAALDVLLSAALASYGSDLKKGRLATKPVAEQLLLAQKLVTTEALLGHAAASPDLAEFFADLAPRAPEYNRLRAALVSYRAMRAQGGWMQLPAGPVLRQGMTDPVVEILRRRLVATGDLEPTARYGTQFDAPLDEAVRRFQRRHGTTADGIVGRKTRYALNTSVEQRIEQIRLNLERRRWMPEDFGANYIFVNLADFRLKVVERGKTVMDMKVVVGSPYWRTPLFSANMSYMEFNPYWNIPQSIVRDEIIPKVQQDPAYLAKQGIRVLSGRDAERREISPQLIDWRAAGQRSFRYRLRQEPGPLNPLGQVKFMFPNPQNIYLHDTQARNLFNYEVRTFSHGCIRIEKPFELAAYLLGEKTPQPVQALLEGGRPKVVRLKSPITVHLAYFTAWVNKDGTVHFRNDVYGRDPPIAAALRSPIK